MEHLLSKKNVLTNLLWLFVIGVVVVLFFVSRTYFRTEYVTAPVSRGLMVDEIYAVGKVEPVSDAYLFFKNPGKITSINVKVGDKVEVGDVLASQDIKDIRSKVVAINAGVDVQKARISQLKAGSSDEAVRIANTSVENAATSLSNAELSLKNVKQSALDALKSAYTVSEDIIRNKVDRMIINPQSSSPKLAFVPASNFTLGSEIEMKRVSTELLLKNWSDSTDALTGDTLADELLYSKEQLSVMRQLIEKISILANNVVNKPADLPQASWDIWREEMASSKAAINTLSSNLTSSQTALSNAESAVKVAKGALSAATEQLRLTTAGTRKTDLAVYEAQLAEASAARSQVDALKQDLVITSPLSGLVSSVDGKTGEISGPGKNLITVLSLNDLEIKINVVENNIVKVKVGQTARVIFDALPNQEFEGKVTAIDPAETEISGTVYYKTTVTLAKKEERIRSGMTANVWITAGTTDNTMYVPVSALVSKDNKNFVQVLSGSQVLLREVEVGTQDMHGNVEIKSGVSDGEKVIIEEIKNDKLF